MNSRFAAAVVACVLLTDALPALAQTSFPPLRRSELRVLDMRIDHVTDSDVFQGDRKFGNSQNTIISMSYVRPQWEHPSEYLPVRWDLGFHARRIEIQTPRGATMANTLQSVGLRVGAIAEFNRNTSLSFQMDPGLYSDIHDVNLSDVSVPFGLRLLFNPDEYDLTWFVGLHVNPRHEFPVIPEIGIRARVFHDWVLHLYLPNPRIVYELNDQWTFNIGAEWVGGAYNLSKTFGNEFERPDLNDTTVTYRDIRLMGGAKWWFDDDAYLSLNGGWSFQRRYTYDDVNDLVLTGKGAPFIQASIHTEF